MKLSLLWLNEWVDHNLPPEKLAEKLTSLGLETKITENRRGAYKNIVVGKVLSADPHPNADALRITSVNAGGEPLKIICGAPNVAPGQTVAVALVGATLPNGLKIEKRKIRGEESFGMICSESELGISAESSGIMVLDDGLKAGAEIASCLELEDVMFEVDLTPNRGDCLSVLGIAREVSAITGARLKMPTFAEPQKGIHGLGVEIMDAEACPRYTALEISGVKIAPSPFKIRRRLLACGVRPINNVVDATNYVMLETGNPLHAFDKRSVSGAIVVRAAKNGEDFTTLDGASFKLDGGTALIADSVKGLAIAGVMGGLDSGINADTTDVILEAAYFNPVRVRRASKKTGIGTESSYRFERGVDPEGVKIASLLAAKMMAELAGGKPGGFHDVYPKTVKAEAITISPKKAGAILGVPISEATALDILTRLGCACEKSGDGLLKATPPSHRHDLGTEIDLVEEISRLHGLDNIPETTPRLPQHESSREGKYAKRREINRLFVASGFYEAINFSFVNPAWRKKLGLENGAPVRMENRINAELGELRTSLIPGLLQTASFNLRQGEEKVTIFETGAVFRLSGGLVEEELFTAGIMTIGEEELMASKLGRNFHRLKGIVSNVVSSASRTAPEFRKPVENAKKEFLYDHRQADIFLGGRRVGFIGEVHPLTADDFDISAGMVCFELSVEALMAGAGKTAKASAISRFPGIKRDVALVVEEKIEVGAIINTILETGGGKISHCGLFDLYQGQQVQAGKKSLAFRLFFMDSEKTMTDKDGDEIMAALLEAVAKKHGAVIRG
ncbi:MAG: phenylalanine--tRNA ligase subunit beta [Nitrospinae bacterium]|nr:phenylalanine--tRNA ligase subunit beta [Nitrospinota bacterium]